MRIAIFSDVHSNFPALEALLDDIARAGVNARYALGDLVGYAPWPNEVVERLAAEGIPTVMGNHDDGAGFDRDECGCAYTDPTEKALGDVSFAWTKAHATEQTKARLRALAPEIRFETDGRRFLLVHGSPRKMNEYLHEDKPDATFLRIGEGANADVIVCGHTHRPFDKTLGPYRFVNVGSAGKPKDGDARACWALLGTSPAGLTVEFRRVAYDIERAATAVEAAGLPPEFGGAASRGARIPGLPCGHERRRARPPRRIAPSAVRFYEEAGVLPAAARRPNGYRDYADGDLARLRLVVALRRLGLAPVDAGRIARLCIERGATDADLAPLLAEQHAAIERQRADLDRLDAELNDLETTIAAAGRAHEQEATVSADPIRVLFVCTGNSARSQLGEALLRDIGGADFEVYSAGTEPKGANSYTLRVLDEVGIEWSGARGKSVGEFRNQPFDYVITVCDRARQRCPVFPGEHNTLHWGLEDPAEVEGTDADKLDAFRRTRMEVATRIRPFVELARRAGPERVAVG